MNVVQIDCNLAHHFELVFEVNGDCEFTLLIAHAWFNSHKLHSIGLRKSINHLKHLM